MPAPKSERWTDRRRASRQQYDAARFKTIGAKMRIEDAEKFAAAARAAGTTASAILTACALDYIAAHDPGPLDRSGQLEKTE